MDTLTARPGLLKQANLSLIRRAIKTRSTATRAEIAVDTKISSTTIRSLLSEMMQNGEIESIGFDESSGGRKAERYRFKPDRYHGAAFCISNNQVHGLLVDMDGEVTETESLEASDGDFERAIISYLDELVKRQEIKSIGLGVPGPVEGGGYWRKTGYNQEMVKINTGDSLAARYGVPVILENDLNATAIGFGRRHEKESAEKDLDKKDAEKKGSRETNMVYLYFEKDCVSAGLIMGGRVIRGSHNFAGELGMVRMEDGRLLDRCLTESMDDKQYAGLVDKIISWICGILNPQYVVLGGPALRIDCVHRIREGLVSFLPHHMAAEILCSPDMWQDYHDGMAYLTAAKMFDEVQFIKEQP